jgi:23S rRNA (guanine745-N1)-methyltransferase
MSAVPAGSLLACPVCDESLQGAERTFRCANGHTFDVARDGYVNLLLAQHRRSKDPGYSKQMIASRRAFFEAAHYRRLADEIAALIVSYLSDRPDAIVLDAGCGEGYYLRSLRDRLADDRDHEAALCGIDISKHAIQVAARLDPTGLYVVAGVHRMPVLPASVDVLVSHFSPVSGPEFARVVRPGGVVLVGQPGETHLFGLKRLLYQAPAAHEPAPPLARAPGLEPVGTHRVRYEIALRGPGQVANLLAMTPFYWSANPATQEALAALDALDTEVDVVLHAYRRMADEAEEASTASGQPTATRAWLGLTTSPSLT